jgi:hypothetical protein
MISELYRSDYDGEFVITNTIFKDGKKEQEREWVENPITNKHISDRATCIAVGTSIEGFLLNRLENHVGGLLGSLSMQVYGVQDVYKKLKCDFLVALGQDTLDEIKESEYDENNIVYTSTKGCLENQGAFYLIPQSTRSTPHATAVWLACFDEHKEIFLFGYDQYNDIAEKQIKMIDSVNLVMKTYSSVKFYHVRKHGEMPESWKYLSNIDSMTIQEYVSYTDIS